MMKGYCVHFSGTIRDTCDKGYNYLQVAREQTQEGIDISERMPCAARNEVSCPDYLEPTQEDIDRDELEILNLLDRFSATRKAIVQYIEKKDKKAVDFTANIPCLYCNAGTIQFSYAGNYNGHIHARCNTPGCVQWTE